MKVILTEKVHGLGSVGEIVNVSAGHARNFLIPRKFAVIADESNQKFLENQQRKLKAKIADEKNAAADLAKKVDGQSLRFEKRVSGSGKLFGTVTANEMVVAFKKEFGIDVEKRHIVVDNPIKQLGDFDVVLRPFKEVEAKFKVEVIIDPKQEEEMKLRQEEMKRRKEEDKKRAEEEAKKAEEKDENASEEEGESVI